mgnify:CR=1 FL=1
MEKTVSAVLVAAGSSTRMGFDKLSFDLGGETVLHRSIRAFAQCPQITELVLVAGKNREFVAQQAADCPKPVQIVAGGATRAESAKNGVLAAHGELVAVHDAARPFVSASVITAALEAAARCGAAAPAVPVKDTIKTVADLEGKKVSVGAAGSGVYFNAKDILTAYGLGDVNENDEFTQINATYQSFGDSANDLKDGKIDAAFIVAGAPTTAVTDLATTKDVHLVSLDDEHIAKLLETSDYYTKTVIPKDVYGLDEDVTTVAVAAVILARNDVSEDAIYALTADIFDNAADLVSSHAKYGELSLEFGSSITSVPYHPGAAKYFAEKGFTVQ